MTTAATLLNTRLWPLARRGGARDTHRCDVRRQVAPGVSALRSSTCAGEAHGADVTPLSVTAR